VERQGIASRNCPSIKGAVDDSKVTSLCCLPFCNKRRNVFATNVRNGSIGDPFVSGIRVLSLLVAGG